MISPITISPITITSFTIIIFNSNLSDKFVRKLFFRQQFVGQKFVGQKFVGQKFAEETTIILTIFFRKTKQILFRLLGFPQLMVTKESLSNPHLEEDTFKEFEDIYKDHCCQILDAVTSLNFTRFDSLHFLCQRRDFEIKHF
jgi:hypothetical protein